MADTSIDLTPLLEALSAHEELRGQTVDIVIEGQALSGPISISAVVPGG